MQAFFAPFSQTNSTWIQSLSKEFKTNPSITFSELRAHTPPGKTIKEEIQSMRAASRLAAKNELGLIPSTRQKMPSYVDAQDFSWQAPGQANKPIKVIGYRHGYVQTNELTVDALQNLVKDCSWNRVFSEDYLPRLSPSSTLKNAIEIGDMHIGGGEESDFLAAQLDMMVDIKLKFIKPLVLGLGAAHKSLTGPKSHPNTMNFDLSYQSIGFMPERVEMEAHRTLDDGDAAKLDSTPIARLINSRSAYMAGYIAGASSRNTSEESVVLLCGGGHLPRIASILSVPQEEIPNSIKPLFDYGYQTARVELDY